MKSIVVLCDGMADLPIKQLENKTPMETAIKPNMNYLAKNGVVGLVNNVPQGMEPGSDIANMSVLGYNPREYYKGRSPIEAAGMDINIYENDIIFRANFVTLSENEPYEDKQMLSYCAGDITDDEGKILIRDLNKFYEDNNFYLYKGVSYRNCLILKGGLQELEKLIPPYDISNKKIKDYLPQKPSSKKLIEIMKSSYEFLNSHPINIKRKENNLPKANSLWLWGEGKKTKLPSFYDKFSLKGTMITAVDLLKGLAKLSNLDIVDVEGATGYIDTNFKGKANAAINALEEGNDFVYIHIEAPDECGHRCEIKNKILSIELIDKYIIKPIIDEMKSKRLDYKIMILPDHPTSVELGKHTSDYVPFLFYSSVRQYGSNVESFNEKEARKTGISIKDGYTLIEKFINY